MDPILVVIWKALAARGWTRLDVDSWVLPSIGRRMTTHEAVIAQTLREAAAVVTP